MMQKLMNLLGVTPQIQPETTYLECRTSPNCFDGDAYFCDSVTGACRVRGCC